MRPSCNRWATGKNPCPATTRRCWTSGVRDSAADLSAQQTRPMNRIGAVFTPTTVAVLVCGSEMRKPLGRVGACRLVRASATDPGKEKTRAARQKGARSAGFKEERALRISRSVPLLKNVGRPSTLATASLYRSVANRGAVAGPIRHRRGAEQIQSLLRSQRGEE